MEQAAVEVFISYAPEDEALLKELEKHLALLVRQGVIDGWHPGRVSPGEQRSAVIAERLDRAQVIVLLVSADFHASHACYEEEFTRALARQRAGKARLIPVIVRACDWRVGPLAALEPLPRRRPGDQDAVPVVSWRDRDEAWTDVVQQLRALIEQLVEAGASHRRSVENAPRRRQPPRAARPVGESPTFRELGERLEDAYQRRDALLKAKGAKAKTAEIDAEILELRRKLREGGQLRAGDVLGGRYLLLERIGRGGFAVVWRAQDREAEKGEGAEREVAIKVLHANLAGDPSRWERFFRGARWMSELSHEAVVRVLEAHGEDEGFHYFVMEYVPGGDLKQAVLEKRLPAEQVIPVILRVCEALAVAHARGMVHRDVKPANILLDEDGEPKLTDFDLVAAAETTGGTRTGALGTYIYAAPEVLDRPQEADARADVYGLGMTAVFCLRGAELPQIMVRDPERVLAALPCGEAVRGVLRRAIGWEREERFADAKAFAEALTFAARRV